MVDIRHALWSAVTFLMAIRNSDRQGAGRPIRLDLDSPMKYMHLALQRRNHRLKECFPSNLIFRPVMVASVLKPKLRFIERTL